MKAELMGFFVFQTVDSINKVFKSGVWHLPHSWTAEFKRVGHRRTAGLLSLNV